MKKALLGVAIIFFLIDMSRAYAQVSKSDVIQVWKRLNKTNGTNHTLYVVNEDKSFNAYATKNGVIVNTNMLKYLKNRDELALVLGHELGHLKHNDPNKLFHTYGQESHADWYGAELMAKSGYRLCNGVKYFKRNIKLYGDPSNPTHPRDGARLSNIGGGCK